MNTDFESRNFSKPNSAGNSPAGNLGALDTQKRDRFELLSAYLDGEVSVQERRQVEVWLAEDPQVQCLYARLMMLRKGMLSMSVPACEQPVEETITQVFCRLGRRRQKQVLLWGGSAIAAGLLAAVSGVFGGGNSLSPQLAQSPEMPVASEPLMLALNQPVVEIPKASVAAPINTLKHSSYYNPGR